MTKFVSKSEQDTIAFAEKFASKLNQNSVIVLSGDLGAGKTKFVQGILKYFGLENEISSPTFTIVNEYHTPTINIYHFDVYRLSSTDEFYEMGGDEYFSNGICLLEWGETILPALPPNYIQITFKKNEENENLREILVTEENH